MLRFSDPAPLTWEAFLADAKGNISESDYRLLCGIEEGKAGSSGFLRQWADMNAKLDDAVNAQRRQKLGRTTETKVVFREFDIERVANAAMGAKNPLEAEMTLMQFRYDYLEREKGFEPFSENALLAYALQLRILIRKDLFTAETGNSEYRKLFGILQKEMKME